jgi:pyruvate dehydrogenase E1 component alpha subunit
LKNEFATEEELGSIDADVKIRVQECADFAESSPYPEKSVMYDSVYEQSDYPFLAHKL